MIKKDQIASFRVESRIHDKVKQIARRKGKSVSSMYHEIVMDYFLSPIQKIFK